MCFHQPVIYSLHMSVRTAVKWTFWRPTVMPSPFERLSGNEAGSSSLTSLVFVSRIETGQPSDTTAYRETRSVTNEEKSPFSRLHWLLIDAHHLMTIRHRSQCEVRGARVHEWMHYTHIYIYSGMLFLSLSRKVSLYLLLNEWIW